MVSLERVAIFMVINILGPAVRHLTVQLTTGNRKEENSDFPKHTVNEKFHLVVNASVFSP